MHLSQSGRLAGLLPHGEEHFQDFRQLGYSSVAGSNSFVALERVMRCTGPPTPPSQPCTEALLLISRLPPKNIMDELITTFFSDVNWQYFIVEKFYFNDLLVRWYCTETSQPTYLSSYEFSQELRYFPSLLFEVVALSLQFLPPGAPAWRYFGDETRLSQKYSDLGVELVQLLGVQGTALTAVQASLLRASWLKNLGRGIDAWRSLGNAIRLSQELGLHRQQVFQQSNSDSVEKSLGSFWYNEYKKRLWINLYSWDSLMALVLGRPMMISNFDCNIPLPIDCDIPDIPFKTVPVMLSNNLGTRPTSLSASLVRYFISTKVHRIRELGLDTPHPKDYSMVGVLHQEALSILDGTKPVLRHQNPDTSWDAQHAYLPQQREELLTVVYTFLTALHRPHISTHVQSLRAVLQAGIVVLDSQQRLFDLTRTHHYMLCHLSFYTVDAAILLLGVSARYPQQMLEVTGNIHRAIQQAIVRLSKMAPVNPTANSGLDVIQRCYRRLQESCAVSLPADAIPAHSASTRVQLQDIWGALSHEQLNGQDWVPAESFSSPGNCNQHFSPTDGSAATHHFDQSYWLRQIDGIYSAANHASYLDAILEAGRD
ncbi:hypothetical protein ABOM_006450 [Aspergillus bombycis]|uniref:Xylanolytic transcriptional activator regulatory domain-containing protein n=1 Tax=Aspergillus bombycis TaxID=109264 RepID=A0A1F8A1S6_9EURO|nr:hypothetical protein ABOM_006450 [Aspergillus bombycis]OGM45258.1 hypothetical protein ABOM_006450 [Aspergillus bombycis]